MGLKLPAFIFALSIACLAVQGQWEKMDSPSGGVILDLEADENAAYALTPSAIFFLEANESVWKSYDDSEGYADLHLYGGTLLACGPEGVDSFGRAGKRRIFDLHDCTDIYADSYGIIGASDKSSIRIADYTYGDRKTRDISPRIILETFRQMPHDFASPVRISDIVRSRGRIFAILMVDRGGGGETYFDTTEPDAGGSGLNSESALFIYDKGWKRVDVPLPEDVMLTSIAAYGSHIVITSKKKIFQEGQSSVSELYIESFDNGNTWRKPTDSAVRASGIMNAYMRQGEILFTLEDGGIVVRADEGETRLFDMMGRVQSLERLMYKTERLAFGSSRMFASGMFSLGIISSEGDMDSWQRLDEGIDALSPSIIEISEIDPQKMILASNAGQIPYYTVDAGETWKSFNAEYAHLFLDEVKFTEDPNRALMITETSAIYEASLADGSITLISDFNSAKVAGMIKDGESLYASVLGVGISVLSGEWKHIPGSPDYSYSFDAEEGMVVAGSSPKIFENMSKVLLYENGEWVELLAMESPAVTTVKIHDDKIYAGFTGDEPSIMVWNRSWERLPMDFSNIHEVAVDPGNDDIAYAAPWGGGLYRTQDRGGSWQRLDVPTFSVPVVIIDPYDHAHILIGDRTRPRVYESFDRGDSWQLHSDLGKGYYRISTIAFHEGDLYISAFRRIGLLDIIMKRLPGSVFRHGSGARPLPGIDSPVLSFVESEDGLYALTHVRGVYALEKSRWKRISDTLPDLGFSSGVYADGMLLIGGGCEIGMDGSRRITDEDTILGVYSYGKNGWDRSSVQDLKEFGEGNGILYAAGQEGVSYSKDNGASWTAAESPEFQSIVSVAVGKDVIYAGTAGGGVFAGEIKGDGNIEWSDSSGPDVPISNLDLLIIDSSVMYATAFPGGVFRSDDGGSTWAEKNFALPSFEVEFPAEQGYYSLAIDKDSPDLLYLGIYSKGIYRSEDRGDTWFPLYGNLGENRFLAEVGIRKLVSGDGKVYAASDKGIYLSHDRGQSWKSMNSGLPDSQIRTLLIDGGELYASVAGYGVYQLEGNEWKHMGDPKGSGYWSPWQRRMYQFSSLRIGKEDILLGHFPSGSFKSPDRGITWHDTGMGMGNDGIFSLEASGSRLFGGTYNGISSYSEDAGWEQMKGLPPEQWVFDIEIDGETIYAATKNGQEKGFCYRNDFCGLVLRSDDGGLTWSEIMEGLDIRGEYYNIIMHPDNRSILFLSSNKGVFISRDKGGSWEGFNEGLPSTFNQVRYNVADVMRLSRDRRLIYSLKDHGLYRLMI
jgi:photosystem II stability/assembly factor-like uncharacterized protein